MNDYAEQVLQLIDHADEFTRSDLQGIVDVLVWKMVQDTPA